MQYFNLILRMKMIKMKMKMRMKVNMKMKLIKYLESLYFRVDHRTVHSILALLFILLLVLLILKHIQIIEVANFYVCNSSYTGFNLKITHTRMKK